ncbi:MAG: ATP-binding protein [Phycisphaerales bacterium]|nr:ATP-binding protein [Phycisphaerales bacterium]
MPDAPQIPRLAEGPLAEALADTPVVIVHGPRQCGKTTLVTRIGTRLGFEYVNLDDDAARRAARDDPAGFVARLPERAIIDEVQRAPELLLPLKVEVDRRRVPGRFLLTGSANVLLLPRVADSLAGRMGSIRLHPLAQCEIERMEPKFLRGVMQGEFMVRSSPRLGEELAARIAAGGFPAALARRTAARRRQWYVDYVDAMVQRDLRDLSRIGSLRTIPKLLKLAASQTARLFNASDLAAPFQVSRPTIRDYVTLLERIFVVDELPPWHSNRLKRLVKTPKLHLADTGLACALLGVTAADIWQDRSLLGQMLETFVYGELRRQASGIGEPVDFAHYRDKDGAEVDIVIEHAGARVSGVEVKASSTVHPTDFRGLRRLREATGKRFSCGVVLYDGEVTAGFGDGMFAVPLATLWG